MYDNDYHNDDYLDMLRKQREEDDKAWFNKKKITKNPFLDGWFNKEMKAPGSDEKDKTGTTGIPMTDGPAGEQGKDWNYSHIDTDPVAMDYAQKHGGMTVTGQQIYSFKSWGYNGAGQVTLYYYKMSTNIDLSGGSQKTGMVSPDQNEPIPVKPASVNVTPQLIPNVAKLPAQPVKKPEPKKVEPAAQEPQSQQYLKTVNLPYVSDAAVFKDTVLAAGILNPYLQILLANPQNHISISPNTAYNIVDIPDDTRNFPTVGKLLDARGDLVKKWFMDRGVKDSQLDVNVTINNYSKSIDVDLTITEYK